METENQNLFNQSELNIFGSSRIGSYFVPSRSMYSDNISDKISTRYRNYRRYETSNHLGNVMTVVSDRAKGLAGQVAQKVSVYEPDIVSAQDYYPFGQQLRNRTYPIVNNKNGFFTKYRYGFNNKEADVDGEIQSLNTYDYGFRIYNTGIARFLSVDPLTRSYPELTPYQFASNTPIQAIDLDGLEAQIVIQNILNTDYKQFYDGKGNLQSIPTSQTITSQTVKIGDPTYGQYANNDKYGKTGTLNLLYVDGKPVVEDYHKSIVEKAKEVYAGIMGSTQFESENGGGNERKTNPNADYGNNIDPLIQKAATSNGLPTAEPTDVLEAAEALDKGVDLFLDLYNLFRNKTTDKFGKSGYPDTFQGTYLYKTHDTSDILIFKNDGKGTVIRKD